MTEDELRRLAEWWEDLSDDERSALIEHRDGLVPGAYREAVMGLMPGGAIVADDLVGPFPLPPAVKSYVELRQWWDARSDGQRADLKTAAEEDSSAGKLLIETGCPVTAVGTKWEGESDFAWSWPESVRTFIKAH